MSAPPILLITVEQPGPGAQTVGPTTGIASAAAFGTLSVNLFLHLHVTGIATGEAFGTTSRLLRFVAPAGLGSTEAFGTPRIVRATQWVYPPGIHSGEALPGAVVLVPVDRSKLLSDLRSTDELKTAATLLDTAKVAATLDRGESIVAIVADAAIVDQTTADAVADIRDVRGDQPLIFSQDVSGASAEDLDNPVAGFEVFGDVAIVRVAAQTVSHAGAIGSLVAFGNTANVIPGSPKTVTGVGAISSTAAFGTTHVVIPLAATTITGAGAMSSTEAFGRPILGNVIFDGRLTGGPPDTTPWTGALEDATQPTQTPTWFGSFDTVIAADGSTMGRWIVQGTTDTTVSRERVQLRKGLTGQPYTGVQWFGLDFILSPGWPTNTIISQPVWQAPSSSPATSPTIAFKVHPAEMGLFLIVQAGVCGGSVPFVYEFKSVDSGTGTTPPGQLWAIPQGNMLINALYQIKMGVNFSSKSPRNPANTGPADGWIKCYYRLAGSSTWIQSVDASGIATVQVNPDGSIAGSPQYTLEIYDLGHRVVYRELQSHGLIVATAEVLIDHLMS